MDLELKRHTYNFIPAAFDADEVRPIMGVKRGTWVLYVAVRINIVFNGTQVITVGDAAGAADGFVADADVTEGTLGLYPGYGTYFSGANGHLYTGDDAIDLTYDYTATTTTGACLVIILYTEIE